MEEQKRFRPITDWCSHKAVFFDDNGLPVGQKSLKYNELTFSFNDASYNFLPSESSYFKRKGLWKTTKYYFYNVNDPMPLKIQKNIEPLIRSDVYKTILDSDLVKKLNPRKTNLLDLIGGWKGLIILGIAVLLIYYFLNGGSLTGSEVPIK